MALSLPYPSIVFVPLDVLTAEELNQMAQNTEFIANQFPIASANIDWTGIAKTGKVIDLGTKRIVWGAVTKNAVPNNADTPVDVTLPAPVANSTVLCSPASWHAWRFCAGYPQNSTSIRLIVCHEQGTNQNLTASYMVIGDIPS